MEDGNFSVVSERDETANNAVLWGTNFNFRETEDQIKNFINTYVPIKVNPYDLNSPDLPETCKILEESQNVGPLNGFYRKIIKDLVNLETRNVDFDAGHIFEFNKDLYYKLIYFPAETILYFDRMINEIMTKITSEDPTMGSLENCIQAVSYTHLTLPTICSV